MEKTFQYNGSKISYTIKGNGKAVVLIHGFAEESSVWTNQIPLLQRHCKLIIPDLPGSGKSGLLQKEDVTIEDYAECLHALLAIENIDSCIMLGHSMGGYITLAFAERYPRKLTAFGLVHSSAFADNDEKKVTRTKAIKFIEQYGVDPFLKSSTPNLFADTFKKEQPEVIAELIEQGKSFSKETLVQYYNAMIKRPARISVLEQSSVPVLFIIGTEDDAAPMKDLLAQVHLPKVSFIHIINDVSHMSMYEKPDDLNSHLFSFITACS